MAIDPSYTNGDRCYYCGNTDCNCDSEEEEEEMEHCKNCDGEIDEDGWCENVCSDCEGCPCECEGDNEFLKEHTIEVTVGNGLTITRFVPKVEQIEMDFNKDVNNAN